MRSSTDEPAQIGPYRLEGQIGSGGMGIVYRAYDVRLERRVALKLIRPGLSADAHHRERLRREAKVSAQLKHPAVVQIYDLVETDEGVAIVMELVEGETLDGLLRQSRLDLRRALSLAREVTGALVEAHALSIVHRDLKAENVLVTAEGHAKVLDFGVAKRLGRSEEELTGDGVVLGTCRTMAPEQANGREVDHRADLFSLGVLLYELFTGGASPFLAGSSLKTLQQVCHHHPPPARQLNPWLPEVLSALIDHLLQKDPARRPQSASEVLPLLEQIRVDDVRLPRAASRKLQENRAVESSTLVDVSIKHAEARVRPRSVAERRLMTVMCCGLGGAGGRPLDPEVVLDGLHALAPAIAAVVEPLDGRAGPVRGQSLLVSFGYPRAHEDDARRAVLAALEILAKARHLRAQGGLACTVRIGVHTGRMILAASEEDGGGELSIGGTPEVAVFLQGCAGESEVWITSSTHRLIEGFFDCDVLAPVLLPGSSEPLPVFRVHADSGTHTRFETGAALTSLVAREQELGLLAERWQLAKEGRGQAVLVAGEPGIGKSRLVREIRRRLEGDSPGLLDLYGSPYHRHSAFHPVLDMLRRWLAMGAQDTPEKQLARLEDAAGRLALPAAETVPFLAASLGLPAAERHPLPPLSPEAQRRKTLDAMLALVLAAAERQPTLLVAEDLHWADPSTLELLGRLLDHLAATPLLLLLTCRPELEMPWKERSALVRLPLSALSRTQTALMVDRLTAERNLPASLREQIIARTDGVPLFIEELTKTLLETGSGEGEPRSESRAIPDTLDGWLRARLDRLEAAREVAQLASALGREFSGELLRAVAPWTAAVLQHETDRLVEAEILYRRGLPPNERFVFKHALLQDAAYGSLLRSARLEIHGRIAQVLTENFPRVAESQPELIAHHLIESDQIEQAIPCLRRAAENAIRSWAKEEAVAHLTRGLALLARLPENAERDMLEISLQIPLGVSITLLSAYTSPEVRRAYSRAWELCHRAGQVSQLFPVLRGIYVDSLLTLDMPQTLATGGQLLSLAEREGVPFFLLTAHQSLGFGKLLTGDLQESRAHLEAAIAADADLERTGADVTLPGGGDPAVEARANLSWTLWSLGYPEAARRSSREACALARRRSFPLTVFFATSFAATLHALCGDVEEVRQATGLLRTLDPEFPMAPANATLFEGWLSAEQGEAAEGIAWMRQGLAMEVKTAVLVLLPQHYVLAAEACRRCGLVEEGLAVTAEALAKLSGAHQGLAETELHRIRGELLALRGGADAEAEALLAGALAQARRQQAKSLELRAAMSLARLSKQRGRTPEAHDILKEAYAWFTEGFDTRDLREARALLAALG
jgi:predicted ATPase/class 3 adenylate cyclase/tRNA A-37 threonylcarbamoyl transferase component Bud32/ABC-type transport system involved in cytochrome c biogenesis ATPase subunit